MRLGCFCVEAWGGGDGRWCLWGAHAVVWLDPFVCDMLWSFGRSVAEFCEGALDISGHGDVNVCLWVVPVNG
jgi:hypothetical protein